MRYYAYCQPLFHKKSVFFLRILLKIDVSDRTDSFCRYPANCNINISGAGALHLPRSNCVSWACVARNTPPERSKPLSGENLIHQVRELRRNLLRSYAVPVGSRNFVPRPLAVEPPTGGKNMRATRPQTPRQVRVTCTPAKQVCRHESSNDALSPKPIFFNKKFFSD